MIQEMSRLEGDRIINWEETRGTYLPGVWQDCAERKVMWQIESMGIV